MRRGTVAAAALLCGAIGCSTMQSGPKGTPAAAPISPAPVSIPTVPPGTPTPGSGAALPTRPLKNPNAAAEKKAGKAIGPIVTFAGLARADGQLTQPFGKNAEGIPIYRNPVGSGFMIVVEGKPGIGNVEVGRSIFKYEPNDPTQRPDLEIEVNRPLGDGSVAVCDARPPKLGGIPAINPPSFAESSQVSATLNDFSCRFETFIESNSSCTIQKGGDFSFIDPKNSKVQFCMVVARAWNFPDGDTLVSLRLRDVDGDPGPVTRFIVQRQPNPTPPPRPMRAPTPAAPRRRP